MQHRKAGSGLLKLISGLISLLIIHQAAQATTVVMPADDDLIIAARAIIRGRVLAISSQLDDRSGRIFSYITVRVQHVFKGQISEREVVLKEEGGEVGTFGSVVFGAPRFQVGERVLLYLDTWPDGSLRVHDLFLGKFSILPDPVSGGEMVARDTPDANTVVIDGASLGRRAKRTTSRMELSAYIAMLRDRLKATRQRARAFEDAYYSGTPMRARPVEFAAGGSGFQPQFTLFPSGTPARWFEPDDGQTVVYTVNLDQAPGPQTLDDMTAAMNAWSTVPGCSLRLVNGGPTAICNASGSNTLVFNNCDGRFSPSSGCASVLAIGGLNWDSSQRKTVNGVTFNRANTGHISFNPYASCDFADSCKLREIATHELGHTVGLGHSEFSDATMFAYIHYDGRCASLRQDDINAIVFVYPGVGGSTFTISTSSPLPPATLGTAYSQPLTAAGGTSPYTWSLVDGQGTLPAGLSLSPGGLISGTPTSSGTSNFTVKVSDSASATAQKALSITVSTASAGYDSHFVLQSVTSTVAPSNIFFVTIRWLNTGSQPWDPGSGFKADSQNPANNTTWGTSTVVPVHGITGPGQLLDLAFQVTAPNSNGIYNFQWQTFQQGVGFFGEKSANVAIVVTDGSLPSITNASTLDVGQGVPVNIQLGVTGGVPPYTWSIANGTLPDGLTLGGNGVISGTAPAAGTASVTFQVTDAIAKTAQKVVAVNVAPPPPTVATASLPNGERAKAYNVNLNAVGGSAPYHWALVGGTLPTGVSLASSGSLSGTPTVDGSFSFTVEVADADGKHAQKAFTLIVLPPPLVLVGPSPVDIARGEAFSYQFGAMGGHGPYTWAVVSGALPEGLALSSITGLLNGVPTTDGTYSAVVAVRDELESQASAALQIRVLDPDSIPIIKKAKYKSGKGKLTVKASHIDASSMLLLDGAQIGGAPSDGAFVVKRLGLSPGQHEVRVVNPGSIYSQPAFITAK